MIQWHGSLWPCYGMSDGTERKDETQWHISTETGASVFFSFLFCDAHLPKTTYTSMDRKRQLTTITIAPSPFAIHLPFRCTVIDKAREGGFGSGLAVERRTSSTCLPLHILLPSTPSPRMQKAASFFFYVFVFLFVFLHSRFTGFHPQFGPIATFRLQCKPRTAPLVLRISTFTYSVYPAPVQLHK